MPDGFFVDHDLYEQGQKALDDLAKRSGEALMAGLAKAREGMIRHAIETMTREVGTDAAVVTEALDRVDFTGSHREAFHMGALLAVKLMRDRLRLEMTGQDIIDVEADDAP